MECLKQFQVIIFGYEIKLFSDHKNLVYSATLRESQRVMLWRLILEEFGPIIQNIAGVDKIVAYTLSRLPSMPSNKYENGTWKSQCCVNELFAIVRVENNEDYFPLNILILQREQKKELRNVNSNLSTYISDQGSGYSMQEFDDV